MTGYPRRLVLRDGGISSRTLGGRASAGRIRSAQDEATLDGLTQLRNDWAFQESLQQEVIRARRFGEVLTLVVVDVDDLRFVNDNQGRQEGDVVLVNLACALRAGRSVDRPFRIGGGKFAVIMPRTGLDDAAAAVSRLRPEAQFRMDGTTISGGMALFDPTGVDANTSTDAAALRERADMALDEAKRRGRHEVVKFTEIAESAPMRAGPAAIVAVRHLLAGRRGLWRPAAVPRYRPRGLRPRPPDPPATESRGRSRGVAPRPGRQGTHREHQRTRGPLHRDEPHVARTRIPPGIGRVPLWGERTGVPQQGRTRLSQGRSGRGVQPG